MGWSIGYDTQWKRDIGYGVPAFCDHPGCYEKIDRGLSYVCGGEPYGGDDGCGLHFCGQHLFLQNGHPQLCGPCSDGSATFTPKPDRLEWMRHKFTDESWAQWRAENPAETAELARVVNAGTTPMEEAQSESAQSLSSFSFSAPGETRRDWRPIETAPKDGSTIILRDRDLVDTGHWTDNWHTSHPWQGWTWHTLVTKATAKQPTHWQPLPQPPGEAGARDTSPLTPPPETLDDDRKDYVDWGSGELLAMTALDAYPIDDGLLKSTSVVFRIHQLGQRLHDTEAQLTAVRGESQRRAEQLDAALERERNR